MNPSDKVAKAVEEPVKKPPQDMLAQIGFRVYLSFPDLLREDVDDKPSS